MAQVIAKIVNLGKRNIARMLTDRSDVLRMAITGFRVTDGGAPGGLPVPPDDTMVYAEGATPPTNVFPDLATAPKTISATSFTVDICPKFDCVLETAEANFSISQIILYGTILGSVPRWRPGHVYVEGDIIVPTTTLYVMSAGVAGTFNPAEVVTGGTSGATGTVINWAPGTNQLSILPTNDIDFVLSELVTGPSGSGYIDLGNPTDTLAPLPVTNPRFYYCTTAGTSDAAEPAWTPDEADTFIDNTANWAAINMMFAVSNTTPSPKTNIQKVTYEVTVIW